MLQEIKVSRVKMAREEQIRILKTNDQIKREWRQAKLKQPDLKFIVFAEKHSLTFTQLTR